MNAPVGQLIPAAQASAAGVQPPQPTTHDVTVVTTKKLAQARVMGVPPEEFGIERNARSIADCNYCFHEVVTKTEADLIDEGFDEDQIKGLTDYTGLDSIEEIERDTVTEHLTVNGAGGANSAARVVKITEHYVRMDYEGKGRPCLYQVITGGDQGDILRKDGKDCINPFDASPFAAGTPIPQPHRFFGRSIADVVMPIQREKTALKRGALDNLYLHNNPRVEVAEQNAGPNTLDDLLVSRPGGVVRTKTAGGLNWQVVPDITASIFPALQYLDAELETRTGVSKQSQGIDANALQNQSATAVAQVFSASQMRMKLIARVLAEPIKDIFSLLHGTIRKHGQQSQTVRLRNQWVTVDPRTWKTRNDMTINVGLGNGSKAQQFAQQMAIANAQKELIVGGKGHMVPDDRLFNNLSDLVKITGHKNADRYFADPTEKNPDGSLKYPPAQPQPDPKVQVAQMNAQAKQQDNAQKAQLDQHKAQMDAVHQAAKSQADIAVAQIKAELDAKLKLLDAFLKSQGMHQQMVHAHQQNHLDAAGKVLDMAATAQAHDQKIEQGEQAHQARLQQMKSKPKADA